MAQIKNKLQQILQIKSDLKTAINDTGCPGLSEHSAFNAYANAIRNHLVYPQGTLNITANRSYDVTNYKNVNVNVPIQIYTTTVTGRSTATEITFTGLPKEPFAFIVTFDGTTEDQARTNGKIIDMHYHGNGVEYNSAYLTGGNSGRIDCKTGDYFYENGNLTVIANATSNATDYFSGARYELVAFYTLD